MSENTTMQCNFILFSVSIDKNGGQTVVTLHTNVKITLPSGHVKGKNIGNLLANFAGHQ
jgi:hypothetical protein